MNIKGAIYQNYRVEGGNTVYVFPDNIASRFGYGIRLDAQNFIPVKWWQSGINISLIQANSSWVIFDEKKKTGLFTVNLNSNHQFQFGKGWGAEIYGFYNGKMQIAETTVLPFGGLFLGIRKKIFHDKASVRIFAEDIFLTQYEKLLIDFITFTARTFSINDSRTIGITFTYNFKHGEQKRKIIQERSMDESKRVNL
jgi:hypothetical protein